VAKRRNWRNYVISKTKIVPGRALLIQIEKEGNCWGILNIYAPNQSSKRAIFWDNLEQALPSTIEHWIMGGDFNMIEEPIDREGGSLSTIQGRELAAWEKLSFKLRVLDAWNEGNFCKLP
jgi:exonuclease III